ncbi:ATP-grasp domain-containing protein [Arthrobacter sp. Soil782]|uniref:ATP-grasp domain-containing protein n=1 Tax=Arthrobacter sp. Soil782 TaxID=1736410 RepID=UPI000B04758B
MTTSEAPKIYALHENPEWFPPFARAFEQEGLQFEEWLLTDGVLDLDATPPEGIFWSRISASAHTRDHDLSKDYARAVLSWLEAHGRRTINGRRVLELEMSKVDQLTALKAAGIDTPRTVAAIGRDRILEAAKGFPTPFITKHNQGGKGLGVRKFESHAELAEYVVSDEFEEPQDGITLIQEFI